MTHQNPPTGDDAFWERPEEASAAAAIPPASPEADPVPPTPAAPAPDAPASPPGQQQWGTFPPPGAYPSGALAQPSGPQQGYPGGSPWPQPGAVWPDPAQSYSAQPWAGQPSTQPYPQQQGLPPQQQGFAPQQGLPRQQQGFAPQQQGFAAQPGYPPGQYPPGQYPPATPAPGKRRRGGLFILLGALVLCLVIVAAWLLNPGTRSTTVPSGGRSSVAGQPSASGQPTTAAAEASDAVQGYLQALAAGKASEALAYAMFPPEDTSLLTDEVLAAGNAIAPISDIKVEPSTAQQDATVQAHYRIGEQDADATFTAVDDGSGWKLQGVVAILPTVGLSGMRVTVNGVPASDADQVTLFPGSYHLATADDRYRLTGGDFTVTDLDTPPALAPQLALSKDGVAAVRTAARAQLASCIKVTKLTPPTVCGYAVRPVDQFGKKFTPKKVHWRIVKGTKAMQALKPKLSAADPTLADAATKVKVRADVTATSGRTYWAEITIRSVHAGLIGSKVQVRFNQ